MDQWPFQLDKFPDVTDVFGVSLQFPELDGQGPLPGGQQPVGSLGTLGFPSLLGEIAGVWNDVECCAGTGAKDGIYMYIIYIYIYIYIYINLYVGISSI